MAGKVISIEIGSALTKVALLDYKAKNTKVYSSFVFDTPEGAVEDGYVKNTEEFVETLAAKLASNQITEKRVVFTISSSKIANREVTLPLVSRDKIMSMIKANASDYFPVDIKNYHLSYTVLERISTKEAKQMKLLLLAVPLDLLESYFDLARTMNLSLQSIDYAGNSIFQITRNLKRNETNVSIHINEKNTIISIMENGVLALQRSISYGADSALETLMSIDKYRYDEEFTREKALQLLLTEQMINTVMPESEDVAYSESDLSEEERDRAEITESLRYLIGNITRVMDYYLTKSQSAKIDMIYLSGIGAEFKGLRELFSFEIGSTVKVITAVDGVAYEPTDPMMALSIMLVAVGAAKNPMGLMPTEFSTKKVKKVSLAIPATVLVAGVVISIAMFAYGQISYTVEKSTRDSLQKELDDMQQYVQLKERYDNGTEVYNGVMEMYGQSENMNQYLVAFIDELEEKMPDSFVAVSFNATEDGVNMGVTVDSLTEAARVIQQLRTFETISEISSSGFSKTESNSGEVVDEDGNVVASDEEDEESEETVTFTLSLTYNKSYGVEATEAE
jgi:type IV pilus assembly protein PilM